MSTTKFIIYYAFILIALLIVVSYYKGASSVGGTLGSVLDNSILFLQGRNSKGNFANYPTGG